jgi:hypothetical protein
MRLKALARDSGGGLIVMPDPFNTTNRELITVLAARYGGDLLSSHFYGTRRIGLLW